MEHLVLRKNNFKSDCGHLLFLCPHNICGFIHKKDCSDLINCCHQSYNIPIVAKELYKLKESTSCRKGKKEKETGKCRKRDTAQNEEQFV